MPPTVSRSIVSSSLGTRSRVAGALVVATAWDRTPVPSGGDVRLPNALDGGRAAWRARDPRRRRSPPDRQRGRPAPLRGITAGVRDRRGGADERRVSEHALEIARGAVFLCPLRARELGPGAPAADHPLALPAGAVWASALDANRRGLGGRGG